MTGPDHRADSLDDRNWGLTCTEFLELTTEYLEKALSGPDVSRFEAHLVTCQGCSTVLSQLRYQLSITGQLHEDDIDPETLTRLLDAFGDWNNPTKPATG
jgi:hypothetical protein